MIAPIPATPARAARHNLPAEIASFIGRERELTTITPIVQGTRLVTLTGAGGCGKTRLALRLASDLVPSYADGVWLIQLAALADSTLVPRAVAAALGIRGAPGRPLLATLAPALASRHVLLVLDNCEHLIGACARLAETLLHACPQLWILATSREPLHIPGEVTWRVPSLALPGMGHARSARSLSEVEAVALFVDRAQARQPEFELSDHNASAVARICCRLEGLPLGIELAAAQVRALAPEQIAARLDDSLRLLHGGRRTLPRQETLRATLDWSHSLLTQAEQVLFRRLAVFSGGFDVEAVESVGSGETIEHAKVLTLLMILVEKSLVEPRLQPGRERYRLLEPVRQYAMERLTRSGELEAVQRRHAGYFLELAEAAESKLMSGDRAPWMERLTVEHDNLRAALSWSRHATEGSDVEHIEVGLRLAAALCWFWNFRGEVSEGVDWLEAALAKGTVASTARAKALYAAGELLWLTGQVALARRRAEESAALFRELGNKRWLAYTLQSLPMAIDNPGAAESVEESIRLFEEVGDAWGAALAIGALDLFTLIRDDDPGGQGRRRLEEALARFRTLRDDWGTAQMLNMLGDLARSQGDDAGAGLRYEEALTLLQRQGITGTVPSLLHNLGYLALRRGDTRRAVRFFRESMALFRGQGDERGMADCLTGLACVLGAMKLPERAASLFGAAEAFREVIGATLWPANAVDYEQALCVIRGQLDEPAFAAAWAAGRTCSLEQAVAEALAAAPPADQTGGVAAFELTPREREVASLVAQGLTSRQIGAELFITEGTARLHVKHILRKLGFTSRAQIAGWAVEQDLVRAPEGLYRHPQTPAGAR